MHMYIYIYICIHTCIHSMQAWVAWLFGCMSPLRAPPPHKCSDKRAQETQLQRYAGCLIMLFGAL